VTTQMIIRIDERQRQKLNQLSRAEGKTTSQILRTLIDDFIKERDISGYVDDLWSRIGKKFSKKGYSADDIHSFILESRKASR
jgi:predicted DNA-binding protein